MCSFHLPSSTETLVRKETSVADLFKKMKTHRDNVQNYPIRILSNKIVDKDVQSIFLPLNLMQNIMFCPKYRIKNDQITPNSYVFNFVSMLGTLIFIFLFFSQTYILFVNKDLLGFTTFMLITTFYDGFYYTFGLTINFIVGILYSKKSVKFILTFQRVHRLLNNKTFSERFIVWTWIVGIITFFYTIIYICIGVYLDVPFFYLYLNYVLICFDVNIFYFIRVIKLLENTIVQWNFQALNSQNVGETIRKHN